MESNFICPITRSIMTTPVILVETGQTYEKEAIEAWFASGNNTCPCTGVKLRSKEITMNFGLKNTIAEYMNSNSKNTEAIASSSSNPITDFSSTPIYQTTTINTVAEVKKQTYFSWLYAKIKKLFSRKKDNLNYTDLIAYHSSSHRSSDHKIKLKKAPIEIITQMNNGIRSGHKIVIDKILAQNWCLDACDGTKYGPIHVAAMMVGRDDADLMQALLNHGCDPEFKDNKNQCTALHWASRCSNVRIIEVLINEGANVNSVNVNGITPLHLAAYWGAHNAMSLLLKNGAERNLRSHKGERPIDFAMSSPKSEASGAIIMLRK